MSPVKVPYEVMALEVEKLYQKEFPDTALTQIEEHCEFIATFIESCGWTTEEYLQRWMHESEN